MLDDGERGGLGEVAYLSRAGRGVKDAVRIPRSGW